MTEKPLKRLSQERDGSRAWRGILGKGMMTMTAPITSNARTEDQEKQVRRMFEDLVRSAVVLALRKVGPDKEGTQRLIERCDEIRSETNDFVIAQVQKLSTTSLYANEVVGSSCTYPKEYEGPRPIEEQIETIAQVFGLDPSQALEFAKNLPALTEGAEGWFAIPSVDALAKKYFPKVTDPAEMYCRAVQLVHAEIAASRKFYNYREGEITSDHLRVHARTAHALDLVAESQTGSDILIVATQLGLRHRGKSVRRAREVFVEGEFGLGSLAVGSITLIHPELFVRWEQLHIDCAGDEFSPAADGDFGGAPCFDFGGDGVRFSAYWIGVPHERYGSASGFFPQ